MTTGTIFNIQKFSVHDGPGIRTTVFFKGCPLNCTWCHNPESKKVKKELIYWKNKCIECGDCLKYCPSSSIIEFSGKVLFDFEKCEKCGICVELCPGNAIEIVGQVQSAEDVMAEIEKDSIFYSESGGGVTFSGGEPLLQIDFLEKLLFLSKKRGIHTAVDTSGCAETNDITRIINNVDLFLYDLKHMDDKMHKKLTGVSNKLILKNLEIIKSFHKETWIRIPVLPGFNDNYSNIEATCLYLKELNFVDVFILPYTRLAEDKHQRLGLEYLHAGLNEPGSDYMKKIADIYKYYGINVKIGG
jgi:pyruvate formate lyase activating enzyme